MVSLESALKSVNLDSYIASFVSKCYTLETLLSLSPSQIDSLTVELQMKKGHIVRFKNLVETLRPIFVFNPQDTASNVAQSSTESTTNKENPRLKETKTQEIITIEDSSSEEFPVNVAGQKKTENKGGSKPLVREVKAGFTEENSKMIKCETSTSANKQVQKSQPSNTAMEVETSPNANEPVQKSQTSNIVMETKNSAGSKQLVQKTQASKIIEDLNIPAKRPHSDQTNRSERNDLGISMEEKVKGLKSMLEGYLNKRDSLFETLRNIATIDTDSCERALSEIKKIKTYVNNYLIR